MARYPFRIVLFFLLVIFSFFSEGCSSKRVTFRIGIDPSFYPLSLAGKEMNVSAFTDDLLKEISQLEGIYFEKITMSWDNLVNGLQEEKYDGMISTIYPYIFNLSTYDFSEPFLQTGPVLLMNRSFESDSIKGMVGKEVAVDSLQNEALLIQAYPDVIVRRYFQVPEVIHDILIEELDGALIDNISAIAFAREIYRDKLTLASGPLNDAGLRMIMPKGKNEQLISSFNKGLSKARDSGIYDRLLKKWGLASKESD